MTVPRRGALIFLFALWPFLFLMSLADPPGNGFVIFVICLGILTAPFMVWRAVSRIKYLTRVLGMGPEIQAQVANIESYKAGKMGARSTYLCVTCDYEYDGEMYHFEEHIEKDPRISKLEAGDELTLIIDPEDPSRAVIASLFTDGTPGEPPRYSGAGGLLGGLVCSAGLLCIYWLPALRGDTPFKVFGYATGDWAFIFWSFASVGYGLFFGTLAGSVAHPFKSAAAGAILLGLPALLYISLESASDGLLSWICAVLVGALGGLAGGYVGQSSIQKQLKILGPALALQRKTEQLEAAKRKRVAELEAARETAQKEAAEAERNLDRCLSCGHAMETHVTCPNCGWSYL